jgi:hypothetical protein
MINNTDNRFVFSMPGHECRGFFSFYPSGMSMLIPKEGQKPVHDLGHRHNKK